jgi:hypothetical protein
MTIYDLIVVGATSSDIPLDGMDWVIPVFLVVFVGGPIFLYAALSYSWCGCAGAKKFSVP